MQGPMAAEPTVQDGRDSTAPEPEDFLFRNVIPKLGPTGNTDEYPSLLPRFGGVAGFDYYMCPVTKQRNAQADGWKTVRDTNIYAIEGPDGRIDLVLLCQGSRIPGADSTNNKRILYLDPEIARVTGLDPVTGLIPAERTDNGGEGDGVADTIEPTDLSGAVDATRVEGVGNFASQPVGVPIPPAEGVTVDGPARSVTTTTDGRTEFQKLKEQHGE